VTVHLVVDGGPFAGVSRADVARRARAMLRILHREDAELSIVLTGDDEIASLNRRYRSEDRPTDVLAFAQREGRHADLAGLLLGDVVISVPTARRQAVARGAGLMSELTFLMAHGLLHLLAWDHDTPAKDRAMRRETQRLCSAAERAPRGARTARMKKTARPPPRRASTGPPRRRSKS
jgi:probable rRNA maturation factor